MTPRVGGWQVMHGGELVSLAFDFQSRGEWGRGGRGPLCHRRGPLIQDKDSPPARTPSRFTYISDVSRIPPSVMTALRTGPQIHVLVLDCLHYGQHFSHFGCLPFADCRPHCRIQARACLLACFQGAVELAGFLDSL